MRRYIALVAILASVKTAHAGFWDGNFLYRNCQGDSGFVNGYVTGWIDKWGVDSYWVDSAWQDEKHDTGLDYVRRTMLKGGIGRKICLPPKATSGQLSDVFCKFLKENPAKRADPADGLLGEALHDAFPCGK